MYQKIAYGLTVCGIALHSYTATFQMGGDMPGFVIGLWAWFILPYAIWFFVARKAPLAAMSIGALVLCLSADAMMFYQVFIKPTSSTAALGLLFIPLWNLILIGPLGASIVGILRWSRIRMRRHKP